MVGQGRFRPCRATSACSGWSGIIGRVGWNTVDGPQILPSCVCLPGRFDRLPHCPVRSAVELRTVRQVAFEVDQFDTQTRTGWSVLVVGKSRAAANPEELVGLWQPTSRAVGVGQPETCSS